MLKVHVKDGEITRVETDDSPDLQLRPQLRACLRGRAYRQRVYDPNRLLYPLKRTGKRGEGKFTRISWDEALGTVAARIRRIKATYGAPAIIFKASAGDLGIFGGKATGK